MDELRYVSGLLSPALGAECVKFGSCEEIRLRKGGRLAFCKNGRQYYSAVTVNEEDLIHAVRAFTRNSFHTYMPYVKKGFIPFEGGIRIGVAARGNPEKDDGLSVSDITSLNVRLPKSEKVVPREIFSRFPPDKSALVYSPPGGGKTTFLRELFPLLTEKPYEKKVCVVDSRGELTYGQGGNADVLFLEDKAEGVFKAIRSLSPDVIILDEIGLDEDTKYITDAKNAGAELICSSHGSSAGTLMKRANVKRLIDQGVFETFIGIDEQNGRRTYEITPKRDFV